MKRTKFYIPVAFYDGEPSLHTGPHGARYYSTEENAKLWRKRHGSDHVWSILALTIKDGESPTARWCV